MICKLHRRKQKLTNLFHLAIYNSESKSFPKVNPSIQKWANLQKEFNSFSARRSGFSGTKVGSQLEF
jgi:hypothetical protein